LTLVDPNRAQLDLAKFKIHLLNFSCQKRLAILGYAPMDATARKSIMVGLMHALDIDLTVFGDLDVLAAEGLDHAGRYEKVFEALRTTLAPYQNELEALFMCTDIQEQSKQIAHDTRLGTALDSALEHVMSQQNLVKIFGENATANRVQDFSKHFAQRIRWYLSHHRAADSAWLAYMLLGHFFNKDTLFPWLTAAPCVALPTIKYYQGFMDSALRESQPESYHVIHLSNILDWLSPAEAQETLNLAHRALKPGGVVIIRQLNSNLDIPQLGQELGQELGQALGQGFIWDTKASEDFLQNDRSFFYRNFFVGFKHKESLAPQVKQWADETLQETPVIKGAFFKNLATMDKEVFKNVQEQFFFAVDYFSRPMAALIARLPLHKDRIDIIHNIVEEHGDFSSERYHANTFKQFLKSIDVESVNTNYPSAVVTMFNTTLMGAAAHNDPVVALACLGIIEYAFADISACIGKHVVDRGWVNKDGLVHYNLHAEIDKQHAQEFFQIIEPMMHCPEQRDKAIAGLRLGAYIFNRLYEDLYQEALCPLRG
jgi:S-adenosylmethionine-diacylglycerol 3-amino-3-carboxypropyl transferase